jgi:translation initiation factor IF-2
VRCSVLKIACSQCVDVLHGLLKALVSDLPMSVDTEVIKGVVIESSIDKHMGVVATVLVREGILRAGDTLLAGAAGGRIRRLLDTVDNSIVSEAIPSSPVKVSYLLSRRCLLSMREP